MKGLIEIANFDQIETKSIINEETKKTEWWVQGIFMQAEKVNKNKRFYPRYITEREVMKFQDKIKQKESLGELNHSDDISINYERACQLITELKMVGNDVYGKAKILETPTGKCLIPIISEGVRIGESSRALGSLLPAESKEYNIVQEDYGLITIDCVSNPSAQSAFVSLMENTEYILENGILKEAKIDKIQQAIHSLKKDELKEGITRIFQQFLNEVKLNIGNKE